MRESKAVLTDRLRREGRWEAFVKRREELRVGGTPAKQAWFEAATEFPPPVDRLSTKTPAVDLQVLKGKPPISVVEAALWAFENLDADWIAPVDAPTSGAWSLRQWARSGMAARGEFYKSFVAKLVLPSQEKARKAEEHDDAWDNTVAQLLLEPD